MRIADEGGRSISQATEHFGKSPGFVVQPRVMLVRATMRVRMKAGEYRRVRRDGPGRGANGVFIDDTLCGQSVQRRRQAGAAPIAAEIITPRGIQNDQNNMGTHIRSGAWRSRIR